MRDAGGILNLKIYNSLKPVIAACNGDAVGIGATMQLPADVRIASKNSRFGFVFAKRGIVPDGCASWFLPKIIGIPMALELCYSGKARVHMSYMYGIWCPDSMLCFLLFSLVGIDLI